MLDNSFPVGPREWHELPIQLSQDRLDIGHFQVMQDWEFPLMRAMAVEVTRDGGDILEVGFGMGISATQIMESGCESYTVIEAHPRIAALAREWAKKQRVPVQVHEGYYQDVAPKLEGRFAGVLFDAYPNSTEEWTSFHLQFFPTANRLLRPGGIFSYFAGQTEQFSHVHLEALFKHFEAVRLYRVGGLAPPEDCEYWHLDYMVLASARSTSA